MHLWLHLLITSEPANSVSQNSPQTLKLDNSKPTWYPSPLFPKKKREKNDTGMSLSSTSPSLPSSFAWITLWGLITNLLAGQHRICFSLYSSWKYVAGWSPKVELDWPFRIILLLRSLDLVKTCWCPYSRRWTNSVYFAISSPSLFPFVLIFM